MWFDAEKQYLTPRRHYSTLQTKTFCFFMKKSSIIIYLTFNSPCSSRPSFWLLPGLPGTLSPSKVCPRRLDPPKTTHNERSLQLCGNTLSWNLETAISGQSVCPQHDRVKRRAVCLLALHGNFLFVSLIGIRPGRVSYRSPGQRQWFTGEKGERFWERLFWGFWGGRVY